MRIFTHTISKKIYAIKDFKFYVLNDTSMWENSEVLPVHNLSELPESKYPILYEGFKQYTKGEA